MKPAAFDYVRAEHLDEALDALRREGGDARIDRKSTRLNSSHSS